MVRFENLKFGILVRTVTRARHVIDPETSQTISHGCSDHAATMTSIVTSHHCFDLRPLLRSLMTSDTEKGLKWSKIVQFR